MTDLQWSLIAAGVLFIVVVFSYNKWQESRAKRSVERAFSSHPDDVLMRAGSADESDTVPRQEPSLYGDSGNSESHSAAAISSDTIGSDTSAANAIGRAPMQPLKNSPVHLTADPLRHAVSAESASGPGEHAAHFGPAVLADTLAASLVDPLIDCLLPLALEAPVRGDKIFPQLHTLRQVGNKPVHYIGLHVNGDWEAIRHGAVYTSLQAGVQLSCRSAALNELEYSELVARLRSVADAIGAEVEFPDMSDVMAAARVLYQFVRAHDAQLGVNLQSNGAPWAIPLLIEKLKKLGFEQRHDLRLVMPDGNGGILFTLSTNVSLGELATARLTLLLDVPCVAQERDGFNAMLACARVLVTLLDATIVDDFNAALPEPALAQIAAQLDEFYQEMDAADIAAGSARALRLFKTA